MRAVPMAVLTVALSLVTQPAFAGSQTAPEIEDAHYDQKLTGGQSACGPAGAPTSCIYIPVDVWGGWVAETETDLKFSVELAQAPPSTFGAVTYTFHFAVDNKTSYAAVGTVNQAAPAGDGAVGFGGVATAADLDGTILTLTVPKAAVEAKPGTLLAQLDIASSASAGSSGQEGASDRAPDSGSGTDYTLAASSNTTAPPANTTTTSSRPPTNTTAPPMNTTAPATSTSTAAPLGAPAALLALVASATGQRIRVRRLP